MVTIRLARGGSKKRPFYHVTVADSQRRNGRFTSALGFQPYLQGRRRKNETDLDRIDYWVRQGAKPSGEWLISLSNIAKRQQLLRGGCCLSSLALG